MLHALLTHALDVSFSRTLCPLVSLVVKYTFQVICGSCLGHKSNPINTDTEGVIESVRSNGVSIISGSCYESQKYTFY